MKKVTTLLYNISPALIITTFTGFFLLGNKSFQIDESYSYYISQDWNTLLQTIWHEELNMWLYYFLLHIWMSFGQSDIFIRSFSVIFAILSVPVYYKIATLFFKKNVAILASILLSIHMLCIFYAQDARSYTLFFFLNGLSIYSFLRFEEKKRYKLLYCISTVLSIYAHIYGIFILLSQIIYLLLKKNIIKYFFSILIIALLLIPLIITPAVHSHTADWMTKPGFYELLATGIIFGGDFLPITIIYCTLFIFAMTKKSNPFLVIWIFIPIIISFSISLVKPMYNPRYFIMSLPPFMFLISDMLLRIKNKKIFYGLFIFIFIFSIIRLYLWYGSTQDYFLFGRKPYYLNNIPENWREATKYITTHSEKNDVVIFYGYFGKLDYIFYQKQNSPQVREIASEPYLLGAGAQLPEPDISLINSLRNPNVWFVLFENTGTLFNHEKQYQKIELLLQKNYKKIEVVNFHYVSVEKFHLLNNDQISY
jgi:uncharacterized membrane protein